MPIRWPTMEDVRPSVDEPAVAAFEQRLGYRLPDDYRRFLLETNGGRPDDSCCQFRFGVVNQFYSLNAPGEEQDLDGVNGGVPKQPSRELLYAGYADGGTRILIALAGKHRGQVWLQDTVDPRPDDANPRVLWHDRRDMKKLADSFEEFVRTLGPLAATSAG
jgi:SMI1 / KNR4 family (SUKH-1)